MQKKTTYSTRNLYLSKHILLEAERVYDYPFTVIEAPMGYGKTTLIKEFLKGTESSVLWQKVYDPSPTLFWTDFSQLFSKLDAENAKALAGLQLPNDVVSMQEAVTLMEASLSDKKVVLVIDDFHLVDNKDLNAFITYIVLREIENLHLIVITRAIFLDRFDELKLKGYAHHITKPSLEFQLEDIEQYYHLCGVDLTALDLQSLLDYTEGWISALYLLLVNYTNEGTLLNSNNIYKIVEKTIYLPFSSEIKRFLLSICLFDSFTLLQAKFLWQRDNVEDLLDEIMTKNAFLKFNQYTDTYQIHTIITHFLKEELEKSTLKLDIYARAANWHAQIGNPIIAMAYYYVCKDFDRLMRTFEEDKAAAVLTDETKDIIIHYFLECPLEIKRKRHNAMLIYAMCLFSFHDIPRFEVTCEEFYCNLMSDSRLDDQHKNSLLGEYNILMSFTVYNDIKAMSVYHKKAYDLLDHPVTFIDTQSNWTFGAPSVLYMFYRESGKLLEHIVEMKVALPQYGHIANGHGSGAQYIFEAEYYFNCGDFTTAEIILQKAFHPTKKHAQIGIITCGLFLQIRLALVRGDYQTALSLFSDMNQNTTQHRDYLSVHTVNLCEGYVYSLLGQTNRIPEWILAGDFSNSRLLFPACSMLCIVYGRILLLSNEYLGLIGASETFMELSCAFPNLLPTVYTHIYLAVAYYKLFQEKDAQQHLLQALELAVPDHLYMPFVENSDFLMDLLLKPNAMPTVQEAIDTILKLSVPYLENTNQIIANNFAITKPLLTEREYQIALLATKGLTNREIGARLYISTNTVKTQLKRVFEKLGISSRTLLSQHIKAE